MKSDDVTDNEQRVLESDRDRNAVTHTHYMVYWNSECVVFAEIQLRFLNNADVAIYSMYHRQMVHYHELIAVG